jgi:adenylosuccinate lyase
METYENPLVTRYASREMAELFGEKKKFSTWRALWVALAEAEKELGLDITAEQINQMKTHSEITGAGLKRAAEIEKETRHDVMAHIRAYGEEAPAAAPIIHLGATSAYVTDNTDLLILRDAMELVRPRLVAVIRELAAFAEKWKTLPCVGYTHYQSAQPVTVGKRACLWIQDLISDLADLDYVFESSAFLGVKGATGTQASFLALFDGNAAKVGKLETLVAKKMGYKKIFPVAGQTYPRKLDARMLNVLAGIASSAMKFANDVRLLAHDGEMQEPTGSGQVGSSAMAYKRNPMRSERIVSLGRFLITLSANAHFTAANQWLERTLDDSANRRIVLSESFLAAEAVLIIYGNVASGLKVNESAVKKHVEQALPYFATENLIMAAVKRGANRQSVHEAVRRITRDIQNSPAFDSETGGAELVRRMRAESAFGGVDFGELLVARDYVGLAPNQVDEFLEKSVKPALKGQKIEKPKDLKV